MEFKDRLYPFTTEMISGYFPLLNLENKKVLTVGSSLDQAFNAILLGAKDVTVYDLNPKIEEFYKLKKELILTEDREKIIEEVLKIDNIPFTHEDVFKKIVRNANCYLESDSLYKILREKLSDEKIKFITGNIYDMNTSLEDEKYDRIIFSNALQYLFEFYKGDNVKNFLNSLFSEWNNHLNKDGILQLLYLYSYSKNTIEKTARCVISHLCTKGLEIESFYDEFYGVSDAIVTYTKRR